MKKICILLSVLGFGIFLSHSSIAVNETPTVHIVFNQVSYHTDDEMIMEIHLINYNELFGFQIDLAKNFSYYTTLVEDEPYVLSDDMIFSDFDTIWVNDVRNDVATLMISRPMIEDFGYNYTDKSLLATIHLKATTTIEDVYSLFVVSDDYSDLQYGNANLIVKLSDTLGYPIAYDYVGYQVEVPEVFLNPGLDTIYIGDTHVDEGITVNFDGEYDIIVVSNIDTSVKGDYEITYTIDYGNGILILVRHVSVTDLMPNIEFIFNDAITTLFKGQSFTETGCNAMVNEVSMPCQVIDSNLDTSTVGEYYITYGVEVEGLVYKVRRYIQVINPIAEVKQMLEGEII